MRRPQPDPPRLRRWKCRQVYHVYQRGSQSQIVFPQPADQILYLIRLNWLARRYKVRIHAFCLMTNHVHFMFEPLRRGAISRLMQHLQSYHARLVNSRARKQGHLWRNHFHAKHIATSSQYCDTLIYIERNPTAASMTKQGHHYAYSSARAHLANQADYTVTHKKLSATVTLYLDRWRQEFQIVAGEPTRWDLWLERPREASFLQDLARWTGGPLPKPTAVRKAAVASP
ncbi:MAG: transposase [Bryobacteraceae bacterium]|nr:transposase [Bryobacteraceae bacterium]